MAFILSGYVFDDVGNGINGATVKLLPNGSNTPDQTTSTAADANAQNGYWTFTTGSDKQYNIEVDYQGHVRKYYSPTGVQFNNLTIGINALQVDLSGNLTMSNPLAPLDGSFRLSPLLKLQGSYDSNAVGGSVTQTNEWMALQTTVAATTGAYKLSFINMASAEIASLSSVGLFNVASGGDIQINTAPVITTIASAGGTVTPVKTANSYDLAVVANTTNQKVNILNNGSSVGTRKAVNFIPGTNITYTIADNAGSDRVDVTVTASGTITGTAGGVTNATDAIIRADDDGNASGTVILRINNADNLVVANGGDVTLLQNLIWKSGTAFKGTFDHANAADRIYTFQDSSDTIVGRATTDTLTNKTITSPSIGGTVSGGATYSGITHSGTTTATGNIDFNGNGLIFKANFTDVTRTNRFLFQDRAADQPTRLAVVPSGTAVTSGLQCYAASTQNNTQYMDLFTDGTNSRVGISSNHVGAVSSFPIHFQFDGVTKVLIDTSFKLDLTSSPGIKGLCAAKVYATSNIGVLNNTWTSMALNTEIVDTAGIHAANATTFVIPTTGLYYIGGATNWVGNATGARGIRFWHNGTTYIQQDVRAAGTTDIPWHTIQSLQHLAAADTVELQLWQNSGGTLNANADSGGGTMMWLHQLSID